MVRAPCCEKMGLKKGPWAPEEDQILINYIQTHGHSNWRALPKHAGLLRCGKSCRLRWTNYLRPDIKRGNFTAEEEDTIFKLHQMLGNRWSAIAARLPGRTDNEIKNVWHTHLKKRLTQSQHNQQNSKHNNPKRIKSNHNPVTKVEATDTEYRSSQCSSDNTSSTSDIIHYNNNNIDGNNNIEALDEDFWSEVLSGGDDDADQHFQFSTLTSGTSSTSMCHDAFTIDFCYDVYTRAEELTDLPHL